MTMSWPSRVFIIVAGLLTWSVCSTVKAQRDDDAPNTLTAGSFSGVKDIYLLEDSNSELWDIWLTDH